MRRKPAKVKRRNAAAKALASPRYRQRRIPDKRKRATGITIADYIDWTTH